MGGPLRVVSYLIPLNKVKHCLKIVASIAQTERGSSILLEMKTDLYLRTLMHQG